MQFKKILVPVDGSRHSVSAAECARDLAKAIGSDVVLLHCHRPFPVVLGEPLFRTAVAQRLDESNKLMEPFKEIFDNTGILFTDRILEGPPGNVIPEVAEIESCDLIVMGSRGRSDLEGFIMGSVAHKVLHTAECPVLIVK